MARASLAEQGEEPLTNDIFIKFVDVPLIDNMESDTLKEYLGQRVVVSMPGFYGGTYYGKLSEYDHSSVKLNPYFGIGKLRDRVEKNMLKKILRPWRKMPDALLELLEEILDGVEPGTSDREIVLGREQMRISKF